MVHTVYCARSVEPIHDPNTDPVARRALYVPQKHAFSLGTTEVSATRQQPLETTEVFLSKRFTAIIGQTLAAAETHPTVPFVPAQQMSAHFALAANSPPFPTCT